MATRQSWSPRARPANSTPTSHRQEIDRELERDPVKNRAEYLAEFRADIESFVSIEACSTAAFPTCSSVPRCLTLVTTVRSTPLAVASDSMTLAIAHYDYNKNIVVIDALREARPPFSPEFITIEFAKLLSTYHVDTIMVTNTQGSGLLNNLARWASDTSRARSQRSICILTCCR